jgi:hypothetical protein
MMARQSVDRFATPSARRRNPEDCHDVAFDFLFIGPVVIGDHLAVVVWPARYVADFPGAARPLGHRDGGRRLFGGTRDRLVIGSDASH